MIVRTTGVKIGGKKGKKKYCPKNKSKKGGKMVKRGNEKKERIG